MTKEVRKPSNESIPSQEIDGIWMDNSRKDHNTPLGLMDTMRSLKVELDSFKDNNKKMMKAQDEQHEINAILLQNLIEIKTYKQDGQTSNNARKGPPKENSHKKIEHSTCRENSESIEQSSKWGTIEETSDNNDSNDMCPKTKRSKGPRVEL